MALVAHCVAAAEAAPGERRPRGPRDAAAPPAQGTDAPRLQELQWLQQAQAQLSLLQSLLLQPGAAMPVPLLATQPLAAVPALDASAGQQVTGVLSDLFGEMSGFDEAQATPAAATSGNGRPGAEVMLCGSMPSATYLPTVSRLA